MTDPLEIAANVLSAASIGLAGRNSVHTWWVGIAGCALFAIVFVRTQLYADATLQVFFIATSAVGWWQLLLSVRGGVLGGVAYGSLLHFWTDAYAPFLDSLVLSFSVVAQLLLIQRRLETWPTWLLVNTLAVPLFASRGLYVTAALYAAYWINAIVSWRHWRSQVA